MSNLDPEPSENTAAPVEFGFGQETCLNCGALHSNKFCSVCGQPAAVKRLRWSNLIDDIKERLLGMDGKFLRTFRMALANAGEVSRVYLSGNRVKYVGPVGLFLICLTLYLIFMELLGVKMSDLVAIGDKLQGGQDFSERQRAMMEVFYDNFNQYFRTISFFSTFISGFLIWLLNRWMKLNLVEHMVFPFYTEGLAYLISFPQLLFVHSDSMVAVSGIVFIVSQGFLIYAYSTFDLQGSRLRRILKGFFIRVLSYIILSLIAVGFAIFWVFRNRELIKGLE